MKNYEIKHKINIEDEVLSSKTLPDTNIKIIDIYSNALLKLKTLCEHYNAVEYMKEQIIESSKLNRMIMCFFYIDYKHTV